MVRHRSAKPLFLGSNPSGASKTKSTAIAVLFVLEMLPHPSATQVVGSNLETMKKRLSIVFSKFLSPKQGALRVECIETKKATMRRERCGRLQKNPESIAFRIFSFVSARLLLHIRGANISFSSLALHPQV